jgi:transposase
MAYIKGIGRDQITILPDCLEDYVSADNPVRVVDAFVEQLDIGALGFKAQSCVEGRPGYDPRDMLKLYIYGSNNKIRSSRRLQREAGRNLELMWLLGKIVPDFRCIADFRKDNAKAIKAVFREFVKLCDKAGLLSHETVVIDGSKFRAVNSDNNCYVKQNVEKLIAQADEKISAYMAELDAADNAERRAEELTSEDIREVLEYLAKRKNQLETALAEIEASGENQVCTTDPECRLMKTRDGCKPSFNVQTAVEPDNHIIVNFEVTSECVDWHLLEAGITGAKEALGVETLEGVADKGYCEDGEVLKCLLNGDTPTIYPNKGHNCRTIRFEKTDDEITPEMLASKDHETLKKCIAAGVLPDVLKRGDVTLEISVKKSRPFINTETGEIMSQNQMEKLLRASRQAVEARPDEPFSPYFTRDLETDQVTCPMGQILFKCGNGAHWNNPEYAHHPRYHRPSVCAKCTNKCTTARYRNVTFRPGEVSKRTSFYDDCRAGKAQFKSISPEARDKFIPMDAPDQCTVILKFYPNQRKLRIRNQVVEHPFGTVKRWNDGYYLLVKGKVKAAADLAFSFLGYNIKRVLNILGTQQLLALMNA